MFGDLYHNRILELAGAIPHLGRLDSSDGSARKVSRICGSEVVVDLKLDADGSHISEIGLDVEACALGQASASVLAENAIGASLYELRTARDQLHAMLKHGGPAPDGRFYELRHLSGVADYPARHASTLLAFEAAVAAFEAARAPAD